MDHARRGPRDGVFDNYEREWREERNLQAHTFKSNQVVKRARPRKRPPTDAFGGISKGSHNVDESEVSTWLLSLDIGKKV
jgi:hypothetical protein